MDQGILDNNDNQHKYLQIRQALVEYISGLNPGGRLLSERRLAAQVGCNVLTVRKAMLMLVDEGLVVRKPGSGTYVADSCPALQVGDTAEQEYASLKIRQRPEDAGSPLLGMLIHSQSDSYALQLIEALQRKAIDKGISLCCRMVSAFDRSALAEVGNMRREGCTAAILPWYPQSDNEYVAKLVRSSAIPVVIPMLLPGLEQHCFQQAGCFGRNLVQGSESLGNYFVSCGYKRVAFLGPDTPDSEILQKNLCGYSSFVCRNNLESIVGLVDSAGSAMDCIAQKWLAYSPDISIICYDDDHALRFMTAMHKLGLVAPQHFAVASFGNSPVALLADPPLSCVFNDFDFPAGWMLDNALALANGGVSQAENEPELKFAVRQSCGGYVRLGDKLSDVISGLGFSPLGSCEESSTFLSEVTS